ncbi:MAG: ferredoxin [Desulfobacterium sp.]|jgi:ferredoxin|nr:ferredoxin [Desulfobacterium sp.]
MTKKYEERPGEKLQSEKKLEVDLSECVLCDICVDLCPQVFKKNDADYIELIECATYPEEDLNDVIKSCRGHCIEWVEEA